MQRYNIFAPGEYYHILGRGNYKQKTFLNNSEYERFLFLLLAFQIPRDFPNLRRELKSFHKFVQHPMLNKLDLSKILGRKTIEDRQVELVNFSLVPNHYHLTLLEIKEGGISKYMQRVLNSFTKYHNTKYEKIGHLFQGPFKAVHVKSDAQLVYLSAYIHNHTKELKEWRGMEDKYPWSSYQDYTIENRWGELLKPDRVLGQFKDKKAYRRYIEKESGGKEI
jgi:putative transposase